MKVTTAVIIICNLIHCHNLWYWGLRRGCSFRNCIDRPGPMIRCSNDVCSLGSWFHQRCLKVSPAPGDFDDWWCSEECAQSRRSVFCNCKMVRSGPQVMCALGSQCTRGIKFHVACVNAQLPEGEIKRSRCPLNFCVRWLYQVFTQLYNTFTIHTGTGGTWYCSPECASIGGEERDHVRSYALSVTLHGLLDLCHRDVIREADGLAMMSLWRVNMLRFWNGNHFKYLQLGHRLLAGKHCIKIESAVGLMLLSALIKHEL